MQVYQRKVLAFLIKQCYEEYLSWGNDEMAIEGLDPEDQEALTRDLYRYWGSEDEYEGIRAEFSITSLCHLVEGWLAQMEKEEEAVQEALVIPQKVSDAAFAPLAQYGSAGTLIDIRELPDTLKEHYSFGPAPERAWLVNIHVVSPYDGITRVVVALRNGTYETEMHLGFDPFAEEEKKGETHS